MFYIAICVAVRGLAAHLHHLGLPPDAAHQLQRESLRAAFLKCALLWHPDRHAEAQPADVEIKFKQAQESYAILSAYAASSAS